MRFRLSPRLMSLGDLAISSNFRRISRDFADLGGGATSAIRMKIDPYCQRQRCNPLNVLLNIMFLALISWLAAIIHALLSRAYLSVS